jgi:hypothetical protein
LVLVITGTEEETVTASIIKLAGTMRPGPPGGGVPNGNPGNGHGLEGILGAAGIIIELKHGVAAIIAPFSECETLPDAFWAIYKMEDVTLVGWFVWVVILVTSIIAVGYALKSLIKRTTAIIGHALGVIRPR